MFEDDAARRNAIQIYGDAGFPTYEDADGDFFPDSWDVSVTLAGVVNNHPDYTEDFQVSPTPRVPAVAGPERTRRAVPGPELMSKVRPSRTVPGRRRTGNALFAGL